MIARSRWLGAAIVAAMILSGYIVFGYLLIRGMLWLLNQAGRAGW